MAHQIAIPLHVAKARNRLRATSLGVLIGAALVSLWSYRFVDAVIGDSLAKTLLGHDAKSTAIAGLLPGAMFALLSGFAGTFTACNIGAFSAIAPLATGRKRAVGATLRPLIPLAVGMTAVAGAYGAIGALIGPNLPQLSTATIGAGEYPVRLLQSTTVFVLVGTVMLYWGFVALEVARNPFASFANRYHWAAPALMGALIGAFLIGWPFPLFRKMFEFAAASGNPIYGGTVFVLQALGNAALMAALFLLLVHGTGGAFARWLQASPGRPERVTGIALIAPGTFLVGYWGLRVPSRYDYGWWPAVGG